MNATNTPYVTLRMIACHVGKHPATVSRALRMAGIETLSAKGVKGVRLPLRDANRFIRLQWPACPPMVEVRAARQPETDLDR